MSLLIGILAIILCLLSVKIYYFKTKQNKSSNREDTVKAEFEIETTFTPQTKENRVSKKDTYGFTLDVENFIRICLNDPDVKEMIFNALRKGPLLSHTETLGASNMKEDKEDADNWYTVFVGTSQQAKSGQSGFLLRNNDGQGNRVSLRLKRQTAKTHTAQTQPQTPGQVIPEAIGETATLLRKAITGNKEAAAAFLKFAKSAQQPITQEPTLKL